MSDYTPIEQNTGSFVPTTTILDVSRIQEVDVNSPEFQELLVRLYQTVNILSVVLNNKDSAYYITQEFVNSQLFFNPASQNLLDLRPDFRTVVDMGPIANTATATVAHGIAFTSTYTATRIYAAGTDSVGLNYFAIPYYNAGNYISIDVNDTNVVITNNSGTSLTDCIAVIEYLKN